MKKTNKETEIYPTIIKWLKGYLEQKYQGYKKITVVDTHDSDLKNFIVKLKYERYFPEFSTYKIRQDITGFIEFKTKVDLVFVECKITDLSLRSLSQLLGYSIVANPTESILLTTKNIGTTLQKLILNFQRSDILEFKKGKKISLIKWDNKKKDIDYNQSII